MSIILSPGHYFGKEQQFNESAFFKLNITAYQPDTHIHAHYHENAYLSLLVRGGYDEVNRHSEDEILPGEILFRPAGYTHANHFRQQPGQCLNIEFKREALQELTLDKPLPSSLMIYKVGTFHYLYRLLHAFLRDPATCMTEEYILGWLSEITAVKLPSRLPWFTQAKTILENELDTHHTIQSIADRVFVHPIYLARAFKEKEGMTVGGYQLKMKVEKAMALLFTTRLPVTDIAFTAGFSDTSHLIRVFRTYYGSTPLQFRRQLNS
ncbi:helix-turn-helix transcriptional regulator [Chitinophaga qingshengii]|uniref:Helix-turn-helix transcriptional regulator n=1 Tax=Chitinophaga qingshengii TaxID=1569794 RepID=A0ABR7TFK3_9BACT|nr:helix-turn-helix transcriptional regulator [Chitinophaga qingshengii]MBC9929117.1 helix-turn-helix transcriptional regulator [Chitinophaga qingshengii]